MIASTCSTLALGLHRCLCGKVSYGSMWSARRSMRKLQAWGKAQTYRGPLQVYVCRLKPSWHVGHQPVDRDE